MTFADGNSFDSLSNHPGEPSPPRAASHLGEQEDHDGMQIDPEPTHSSSDSEGESPPRFTTSQKAKGKAARIRTASDAGLSPPPLLPRPFTAGDGEEATLEDGQNVHCPPYQILDQEDTDDEGRPAPGNGGFMTDARKGAQGTRQSAADIERDFLVAAALQKGENERHSGPPPAKSFAAAVRGAHTRPASTGSSGPHHAPGAGSSSSQAPRRAAQAAATHAPGRPGRAATPGTTNTPGSSQPSLPKNIWKLFKYKGGVSPEDLLVAAKDGLEVRYWAPSFPVPRGVTFNTLTLFLNDENREGFRNLEGHVLLAWPADIGRADVDELVYTIRLVCALIFNDPSAVKVFPADRNGDLQAPVALIRCAFREHYVWLRNQVVINNSRRPFFVISRRRLPARITHTVTGGGWENNDEGRAALEEIYRDAALKSVALADFAEENHEAVDPNLNITDFHRYLAESITADPLDIFKRGTQTPAVNWRIECARMTHDEEKVKELNALVKNLTVHGGVYGTPQVIRAPKCGMCGCVYHPQGKCEVAGHPSWLGPKVKTAASAKPEVAPAPDEDETLPNGNMRRTAALLKDAPGPSRGKSDKKGKGKN